MTFFVGFGLGALSMLAAILLLALVLAGRPDWTEWQ